MVKNTGGGNKAKKFANKSFNIPNKATRFSCDSAELYAVVNKLMGGNICEVFCIDGSTRLCVIRNKFSGKGKRDNFLSKGKWVLVGLREWETINTTTAKNKCDLLEVYNDNDKEKLIKSSKEDFKDFLAIVNDYDNIDNEQVQFSNNIEQDCLNEDKNESNESNESNRDNNSNKEFLSIIKQTDWINSDDI